VKNLF
jgi:hypothetical protein